MTGDSPLSELQLLTEKLEVQPGGLLIDLGCGIGGPGLWIAKKLKAVLLGLDIDSRALSQARQNALGYPATYEARNFEATGLPDACADGVISLDALWHPEHVEEALRILKPGKTMALTMLVKLEHAQIIFEQETEGWKERRPDKAEYRRRLMIIRRPAESPVP